MVKFFFTFHDPTTLNQQGNDRGTQYASVIFTHDDKQKQIADKVVSELNSILKLKGIRGYSGNEVTTKIHDANEYYPAMAEH